MTDTKGMEPQPIPRRPATPAERFATDTATHRMTVAHDDGLHRHLRFRKWVETNGKEGPSSSYWFDLVTWPGYLTIAGDCGTYTFARTDDMFEFFRGSGKYGLNPGYWAEKVRAQEPSGVSDYSQDKLRAAIADYIGDPNGKEDCAAKDWPGLAEAIEKAFFGWSFDAEWNTDYEHGAREALDGFKYGNTWTFTCPCGEEATGLTEDEAYSRKATHLTSCYPEQSAVHLVEGFRFYDTAEWDLSDYSWHYLWCCHAIVWGIAQYDAVRAAEAKQETAGAAS